MFTPLLLSVRFTKKTKQKCARVWYCTYR